MDVLLKTDHLDLAISVYEDFKEDGLVEESVTYMILIKALYAGRLDEVFELLGRMKGNLSKPDMFAYTTMIWILVSRGNLDECVRVWEEMQGDGVEPNVMAYTTLITGLCKGNEGDKGYELFKKMREKGYLIDSIVYGSLTEQFVANRRVGLACDLLKDPMESSYQADLLIYNSLIKGLCNMNQVDKAYKLFQVTVKEGLGHVFVTINPILVTFVEQSRMN